jgi:CRP/FNR family cyclic AMP-dependent transcriptional regulator
MRKALYLLGQLDDLDIEWMIEYGRRESIPRGHAIITQAQQIDSLYVILTGRFIVVNERDDARELARLGSGEIVGEMSFVDAAPPSATVKADEESTVLALPRASLKRKLQGDPAFAARFYRAVAMFLSDRLRATSAGAGSALEDDELDPNVLDTVHLAGQRFDRILKRLLGD